MGRSRHGDLDASSLLLRELVIVQEILNMYPDVPDNDMRFKHHLIVATPVSFRPKEPHDEAGENPAKMGLLPLVNAFRPAL